MGTAVAYEGFSWPCGPLLAVILSLPPSEAYAADSVDSVDAPTPRRAYVAGDGAADPDVTSIGTTYADSPGADDACQAVTYLSPSSTAAAVGPTLDDPLNCSCIGLVTKNTWGVCPIGGCRASVCRLSLNAHVGGQPREHNEHCDHRDDHPDGRTTATASVGRAIGVGWVVGARVGRAVSGAVGEAVHVTAVVVDVRTHPVAHVHVSRPIDSAVLVTVHCSGDGGPKVTTAVPVKSL